ncbi:radical SAM protein [Clostridioides sp. ZZV14-6009]|uniref:SPL family radical SAM protein n=1 Tax=unclassified Clostridioides TaxID=2635829 RepID=UPI001D12F53C|nr:radical SAM protein [Clostridioides sp. ZZV14-6045]MCC0730699.1 radical SAM protein [Clostridioides sp. ZZV14-6048]MCC0734946.1 radical SAM protein [Clostridioides sp. ZZV14-6009]
MYNKVKYTPINCETACNKLKRSMPYKWDLNIYRGCEHACKYCYAIYSHKYMNSSNYFEEIYVKTNIIEKLEKQLSSSKWNREVINIGGVTDSYQPIEAEYKIMPEILNLLIKYKTPAIISTKSDLILRDYDLIDKLSRITYINIASTITTVDEKTQKLIEPNGVDSMRRFKMLKEFRKTNASVGLHIMPIIPYITDNFDNINSLFRYAKESNVHYVLPGTLYLRGVTRGVFFDFIKKEFPDLFDKLSILYSTGSANKEYKNQLYKMVNQLRNKCSLSSSYAKIMKEKLKHSGDIQLSFFD